MRQEIKSLSLLVWCFFSIKLVTGQVQAPTSTTGSSNVSMNTLTSNTFDVSGNVISSGKTFYDNTGKLLQTQAKVYYRKDASTVYTHVIATQPIYDAYGRPAASTLAAPIDCADFRYISDFAMAADGTKYSYKNFDLFNPNGTVTNKINNPDPIGGKTTKGKLGWYYSSNNTWEPYTPTTDYPYSRQTFYSDGTGNAKKTGSTGEAFKMGSGHEASSFVTPVVNELDHYLQVRNKFFPTADVGAAPGSLKNQAIQLLSKDANGQEVIVIQDKGGKALMTARPGTDLTVTNVVNLKSKSYTYIKDCGNLGGHYSSVNFQNISGGTVNVTVYDYYATVISVYNGPASGFTAVTNYRVLVQSDAPFTVNYTQSESGVTNTYTNSPSEVNSAYSPSVFYFKILADNTNASITTLAGNSYDISFFDMETETASSGVGPRVLNRGYYKLVDIASPATLTYTNGYTDVSYNFYNQLGQLIATIAPEGVKKLYGTNLNNYATKAVVPFITLYQYNVKGQLISGSTPDGGTSKFVYRQDGKLRFSQSAQQYAVGSFSYTNYDQYGQPVESGEYVGTITFTNDMNVASTMKTILENVSSNGGLTGGTQTDVVRTKYDVVDNSHGVSGYVQDAYNMRGGVSMTEKYSKIINNAPVAGDVVSRTWYSYDEEGKVLWQIKYINGSTFGYKTIDFTYDNLGHLTKKVFQKSTAAETFVHYFEYDPVNQNLWKVYTNTTDNYNTRIPQATYIYYLHGGLKRVELADKLQGIDYTYTLQGALKAINNSNKTADPGQDGTANTFGADAYGMVLDYFPNDYNNSRITGIQTIKGVNTTSIVATESYGGNIKAMTWYTKKPTGLGLLEDPLTYVYKYDPKYQFTESVWGTGINFSTNPASFTSTEFNKESIYLPSTTNPAYDANGNILNLQRTNGAGILVDKFAYSYVTNTNKLSSVVNTATTTQTYGSYGYDLNGQVISETTRDPLPQTKYFKYDVTGKVILVSRDANFTQKLVEFVYDETGIRIMKKNYDGSYQLINITYYTGDAIYTQSVTGGTYGAIMAQEYPIHGASGRLGIFYRQAPVYAYQLTDHLGNIRAVIAKNGSNTEIRMYTDYYPFGMTISKAGTNDYRYGYQGNYAEKDEETKWNAFELRMYSSRIARWLQFDPKNIGNSPYISMNNNPVNVVDPDGGKGETTIVDKYNRVLNIIDDGKVDIIRLNDIDFDDWIGYFDGGGSGDIFNEYAFGTGELLSLHTLNWFDFMYTNEKTGGYDGPNYGAWLGKSTIPGFENFTGKEIARHFNAQWVSDTWAQPEEYAMLNLGVNSRSTGYYDIKHTLTEGFTNGEYTSVMWDGNTVTTMRAVGNILFGMNMNSARAFYNDKLSTWNTYMPWVGKYNQVFHGGNGYNSGFPFYGEHDYSGTYIYMGYFGDF